MTFIINNKLVLVLTKSNPYFQNKQFVSTSPCPGMPTRRRHRHQNDQNQYSGLSLRTLVAVTHQHRLYVR